MTEEPSPPGAGYNPGPPPNSYLVWGIVTTILCCLPLGVVSIVKATKVGKLWATEQPEAALAAARSARGWAIAAAVTALVLWAAGGTFVVQWLQSLGEAA